MAGSLSRLARRVWARWRASLRISLAAVRKFRNHKLAASPVICKSPGPRAGWRLKIGLHGRDHPRPFVDQAAPAPRQPLEDVVLFRRCHDFLEHVAGRRQVIAELEQFEGLDGVDRIALGGGGKDLLEARQLQIVDVEEPPAPGLGPGCPRAGPKGWTAPL